MAQSVRIDPGKLIEHAEGVLASNATGRPRAVWLRRAVSSAYYALFHAICLEGARTLLPHGSQQQQLVIARAFGHREVKDCCSWIAGRQGGIHQRVRPVVDDLKNSPLVGLASAFCDLQEARHRADYDHMSPFTKAAVAGHIEDARKAMGDLDRSTDHYRHAFYTLLALKCRLA